ncbi:hypothetical protein [uncultured Imperialibacter sp.]
MENSSDTRCEVLVSGSWTAILAPNLERNDYVGDIAYHFMYF